MIIVVVRTLVNLISSDARIVELEVEMIDVKLMMTITGLLLFLLSCGWYQSMIDVKGQILVIGENNFNIFTLLLTLLFFKTLDV